MEAINPNKTKERRSIMKRAFLIALVFMLCITTFCISAFAVNGNTISKNGGKVKWYSIISGPGNSDNGVTANTVSTTLTLKSACKSGTTMGGVGAYCTASITINGNNKQVWNKSGFGLHSATASKQLGSHSVTCYKTTYAWNAAVKGAISLNSGSAWSGTSTASTTAYIGAKPYYSCYCDPNGGSGGGTVGGYYGDTVYLPGTPSRTGYTFTGWSGYGASAAFAAQNLPGGLTAGWSVNSYTFDLNGYINGVQRGWLTEGVNSAAEGITAGTCDVYYNGNLVANDVADYCTSHTYGSSYSIADIKAAPGFVYNGVYSGSTSGTMPADNVSVFLSFSRKTATLAYNNNGHGTMPANVTMDYWTAYTAAAAPENPSGYVFKEWNTKADGTGTPYAPGASVKAANVDPSAITLYAIWKHPGTITITKTWDDDLQGSDQSNRTPPEITIKGERVPQ